MDLTRHLRNLLWLLLIVQIGSSSAQDPTHLIAFQSRNDGNPEIYVMQFNGQARRNLTNHPARDVDPAWSPDGRRIAFASNRSGNYDIWIMDADGSNLINVTNTETNEYSPRWSPDGKRLLCQQVYGNHLDTSVNRDICLISLDSGNIRRLTNELSRDRGASWAPDGKHFVYVGVYDIGGKTIDAYMMNIEDRHSLLRLTHSRSYIFSPQWISANRIIYRSYGGIYQLDLEKSASKLIYDPPLEGSRFDVLIDEGVMHFALSGRHEDNRDNDYGLWHYNVQTKAFSRIENTGPKDFDVTWQPIGKPEPSQDSQDDS